MKPRTRQVLAEDLNCIRRQPAAAVGVVARALAAHRQQERLGGEAEADETYIHANMHADKLARLAVKRGRSVVGETFVIALLERHDSGRNRMPRR